MSNYIEIGKLNRDIFKKLNIELITDQVIFTFERVQHVEDRRRNVYYEVGEKTFKKIYKNKKQYLLYEKVDKNE